MKRLLFKGVFALPVEMKRPYTKAYSLKQATKQIVEKLAKEQDVDPKIIWNWMKENPGCYKITLEEGKNGR